MPCADPTVILRFAEENEWELRDPLQTKRVFLGLVGPQVVRIRCDLGSLRQGFAQLTIDEVYEVAVLLCEMLVNLDKPSKEEEMLFKKYEKEQARLYAGYAGRVDQLAGGREHDAHGHGDQDRRSVRQVGGGRELSGRLVEMLQKVVKKDVELYRNLLPLKGVMLHLE